METKLIITSIYFNKADRYDKIISSDELNRKSVDVNLDLRISAIGVGNFADYVNEDETLNYPKIIGDILEGNLSLEALKQ